MEGEKKLKIWGTITILSITANITALIATGSDFIGWALVAQIVFWGILALWSI
jgi:hypothetical protein